MQRTCEKCNGTGRVDAGCRMCPACNGVGTVEEVDNVIPLGVVPKSTYTNAPPKQPRDETDSAPGDAVLLSGLGKLSVAVVIGYDLDGNEHAEFSFTGGPQAVWLLERIKLRILTATEEPKK
jgi:hypothetical protein